MPRQYTSEAVDYCFELYLRFNGQNYDRIEREMRRKRPEWSKWSKQNLTSHGDKLGWVEKFGWESALKDKLATASRAKATSEAQTLYNEIVDTRKALKRKIDVDKNFDRDLVYQHQRYCQLSVSVLSRLENTDASISGFVAFWERLLDWLPDINQRAARELLNIADEVMERAQIEFGGDDDSEEEADR